MMKASRVDGIVCFSTDPWGEMKRPGQLMRCLSREVPVLYVEPYLSVSSLVKNPAALVSPATRARLARGLARTAEEVAADLHVMTSMVTAPPQRLWHANPSALATLSWGQHRAALDRAFESAGRLGMRSPALWISYPVWTRGARDARAALQVYDCMDRWTDFPDTAASGVLARLVAETEQRLFDGSDLVFCSAEGLFEWAGERASGDVGLVRNGADTLHFEPAGRTCPADLADLPRPLLGYVGAVAQWVDFELLRAVALARPEWSIALVGPAFRGQSMGDARALRPIADLPNVHLLGPRDYADLPAYYEAFDAALIPFVCNGLTADTNPIKLYEYLAAGLPVVSTPLREVASVPAAFIAATAEQFVQAAERAVRERHDRQRISARMAVAREHSWQARADAMWRAMQSVGDDDVRLGATG